MNTLCRHILTFVLIGYSLCAVGFRSHRSTGQAVVTQFEETFVVDSQIEHYRSLIIAPDITVTEGDLILAYSYQGDKVYGVVHLTKSSEKAGFTMVSIQEKGEVPKLYLWEPGFEKVKELRASDWRGQFAGTPWNFEDMLDDDKEDWSHINKGVFLENGEAVSMIESTYENPELKRRSAYQKRQSFIAQGDKRFMKSVFYNRAGVPFKTFRAKLHKNYGTEDKPLIRAARLEVVDNNTGLMTLLQIEDADYDLELPMAFFDPASLSTWSEKQLPRAIALARGNINEGN